MDISQLNWFDYCAIVIIASSLLIGAIRGFFHEVIALLTWASAFTISILFAEELSSYICHYIKIESLSVIISFLLLFITVLIIGTIINYLVVSFVMRSMNLIWINHFFGAIFGFVRGGVITLLVVFLLANTAIQAKDWFKKSYSAQLLKYPVEWMKSYLTSTDQLDQKTKLPAKLLEEKKELSQYLHKKHLLARVY